VSRRIEVELPAGELQDAMPRLMGLTAL